MTGVAAYCLDWRSQFAALDPYFRGAGGVIRIHAGPGSPSSIFAKVLRHKLATVTSPYRWSSVQIDPLNANTHYLPDIVRQIEKSVGIPAPGHARVPAVSIGNGVNAGGSVTIRDVDISVMYDDYDRSAQEDARIAHLRRSLSETLKTQRVALLFINSHLADIRNLTEVRHRLWDEALAALVAEGLLVLDLSDPLRLAGRVAIWPPDPSLVLDLPDRYDSETRTHALQDLTEIALEQGWFGTGQEASASAKMLLATSVDINSAYASLTLALAGLGVRHGSH